MIPFCLLDGVHNVRTNTLERRNLLGALLLKVWGLGGEGLFGGCGRFRVLGFEGLLNPKP